MTYPLTKRDCFVFDIDGTIADCSHRQGYLKGGTKNWDAFNKGMPLDSVIKPTYRLMKLLQGNISLVLLTGREASPENYKATLDWLSTNEVPYTRLFMREHNDYRCDNIVKLELIKKVEENFNVIGIFDDRVKVVKMWRDNGYYVFDVNQTGEVF